MAKPIKLEDIVDGMQVHIDEHSTYLNTETAEVVHVAHRLLRIAEEEEPFEHLPDWEQDDIRVAMDIVENEENYVALPSPFYINEYEMMEDFCYQLSDQGQSDTLLDAIRGKGAFRRFKDEVNDLGIEKDWYAFRDERYKEIAIRWCNDWDVKYVE